MRLDPDPVRLMKRLKLLAPTLPERLTLSGAPGRSPARRGCARNSVRICTLGVHVMVGVHLQGRRQRLPISVSRGQSDAPRTYRLSLLVVATALLPSMIVPVSATAESSPVPTPTAAPSTPVPTASPTPTATRKPRQKREGRY